MSPSSSLIDILLVEDDPTDVLLTRKAFEHGSLINRLHVVGDGEQCLDFLRRREQYNDAPRPDLILLDLNMPRMDGREVLDVLKQDEDFKSIPVIILTTSDAPRDIADSYARQASCYITKPVEFDKFVQVVTTIQDFWLGVVKLPNH